MKGQVVAILVAAAAAGPVLAKSAAEDQPALDACIESWGKKSPFKKGTRAETVIAPGVKVFGGGGGGGFYDQPSDKAELVLVKPAVNVMGKSTIKLGNPKGWYCFKSNVTVAGKIEIDAPCNARLASAKGDGTTVGAVDESNKGVAVFGVLRVTRHGCDAKK
jgi:hypothetical protein